VKADTMIWEKPPSKETVVSYGGFYGTLIEFPFEWARYPGTQSAASQWCQSHPEFEYQSAMVEGQRRVWMRFTKVP